MAQTTDKPDAVRSERDAVARGASLLSAPVKVITVGLDRFAKDLEAQGVPVVHVAWQPPAGGDARLAALLSRLGA